MRPATLPSRDPDITLSVLPTMAIPALSWVGIRNPVVTAFGILKAIFSTWLPGSFRTIGIICILWRLSK